MTTIPGERRYRNVGPGYGLQPHYRNPEVICPKLALWAEATAPHRESLSLTENGISK
jgi:hypothetical protein